MNLSGLLPLISSVPAYAELIAHICNTGAGKDVRESGTSANLLSPNLPPLSLLVSAHAPFLAALQRDTGRPILVITARSEAARQLVEQIRAWSASPDQVLHLADPDALPYERIAWSRETVRERLMALTALVTCPLPVPATQVQATASLCPVIVASARAIMQKTLPRREFCAGLRHIRAGQALSLNKMLEGWLALGYTPASVVEEPGTFSRHGGIVDIFPANLPYPVRVELFGDEIESLRTFDPTTQRSEQRISAFTLAPASEALPIHAPLVAERVSALDLSRCHAMAQLAYREHLEKLATRQYFRGSEFYLQFMHSKPGMVLEYLLEKGLLAIEDPLELAMTVEELEAQALDLRKELMDQGELPSGWELPFFTWAELTAALTGRPHLLLGHNDWPASPARPQTTACTCPAPPAGVAEAERATSPLRRVFRAAPRYGGQLKGVLAEVAAVRGTTARAILVSRQAARLSNLLAEEDIYAPPIEQIEAPPMAGSVTIVQGTLAEGWLLMTDGDQPRREGETLLYATCAMLTDAEIFGWSRPQPRRRERVRGVTPETFFADVKPGDYVVHIEHGIGIFRGLVKLDLEGVEREYLEVDYAAGDKLYVPVHHADRLSRYVGADEREPPLNRLGTADWATVKKRARRAVEEIARELLELYSAREVIPGHAFSPDTTWQAELEASFPYIETEDQLTAIETVKADMEKPTPMDRLVCGDVGYGKTEVALRAAFKAIMDGKQVAILVPTTVLAQQHYETFRQRLSPFPVEIEMLSRFRLPKAQREVLEKLKAGVIDIVIGTHRLIQKDVAFKDLGLLIIDEEQRFGVAHKERLKQMRKEVDVLTLTATPIPRTLYMSLTGVRDLSTIDTPPEERLPIQTYISEYDETLIRTAILREIGRGGQVFFVHNRVIGIQQMAQRVAKIVPEATIAIAHGQMPERELEKVMLDFASGHYDVLVCTSIIESGLDMPNVNTIIINRADQFGLAELYQLRGRVGRGAVRAYAYLLYNRHQQLTEIAHKRLKAILEASELGAGFRIAMEDLEIRGAGELLGARQHGHIAAVGFDLYCRLLAQAVRELHREEPKRLIGEEAAYLAPLETGVQINLPLAVYLPEDYVPDNTLRLRLYRRLAGLMTLPEVDVMAQELVDRFGPLPPPAENLMYQLRLKILAMEAGAQAITTEEGQICVRAESLEDLDRPGLQRRLGPHVRVTRRQVWMPLHPREEVWRAELEKVLRTMARLLNDPARSTTQTSHGLRG
jgi:transcription-repair coupling factor (superfamily II helicase)